MDISLYHLSMRDLNQAKRGWDLAERNANYQSRIKWKLLKQLRAILDTMDRDWETN